MKRVRIFYGTVTSVEYDVNYFLRSHDSEIIDIKIVPAQYDQWTKVMVIYDEPEDDCSGGAEMC